MVVDMEVDMMADMVTTKDFWAELFFDQTFACASSKLKLRVYFQMMRMDFNVLIWVL